MTFSGDHTHSRAFLSLHPSAGVPPRLSPALRRNIDTIEAQSNPPWRPMGKRESTVRLWQFGQTKSADVLWAEYHNEQRARPSTAWAAQSGAGCGRQMDSKVRQVRGQITPATKSERRARRDRVSLGVEILVGMFAVALLPTAQAIMCYKSTVSKIPETPTSPAKFTLGTTIVQNCKAAFCVTLTYEKGIKAHDCMQTQDNCTVLNVDKASTDSLGAYTYSCCGTDKCNSDMVRLPDAVAINRIFRRPECDDWHPPEYDATPTGEYKVKPGGALVPVGLFDLGLASSERDFLEGIPADLTRATDLKQKFETSREDQRTNWTVNVQPPTARTWLWSRDTSTPNCFMVSGQITQGFCGKRYRLKANGERVKSDVVFDGKYINSYCGGSRAEALALSDDFTIVNQGADREKCMALLLESRLVQDCESIRGRYNVHEMVKARRSLLPDCCVAYIENTKQDRMDCNCTDTDPFANMPHTDRTRCSAVCCCEAAVMNLVPEERCKAVKKYVEETKALEQELRTQCCFTRMLSQCNSGHQCTDKKSERGRLASYSALPLCCSECENYYSDICSYQPKNPDGGADGPFVSMKSVTLAEGLKRMCKDRKLCRSEYPCSFRASAASSPQRRWLLAMPLGLLPCMIALLATAHPHVT